MSIFRKKEEEKQRRIIAIDFNATPMSLLNALNFLVVVLFVVAWSNPWLGVVLYLTGEMGIIILAFVGFDLKKRGADLGWMFLVFLSITLFFGAFILSYNYVMYVIGAYITAIMGIVAPHYWLKKKMKENEVLSEVMKIGYYEKT